MLDNSDGAAFITEYNRQVACLRAAILALQEAK